VPKKTGHTGEKTDPSAQKLEREQENTRKVGQKKSYSIEEVKSLGKRAESRKTKGKGSIKRKAEDQTRGAHHHTLH